MNQLAPQSSFDVATTVMLPSHVRAKFGALEMPVFTELDKQANAREVAFGFNVGDTKEMALEILSGGVPLPGLQQASVLLGVPFTFWAADYNAQRGMQKLAETYREEIAEKTNLSPDQVDENVVLRYATQNETLAAAVKAIAHKRESHFASNSFGVGGMMAGGATGAMVGGAFTGGLGAPIGLIAGLGLGALGFDVGKSLGNYLTDSTDATDPSAIIDALQQKKDNGEMITARDVLALRLAQKPELREAVVARHGDNFIALGEEDQREVMAGMPMMMQQCAKDAVCCNLPEANLRQLMFGEMQPTSLQPAAQPTQWTSRIGGPSSMQSTQPMRWTDAVLQRRAAQELQTPEAQI